ncbi:hypothetical protein AGMMS49949_05730 [Alphaproteobacteria bacterium]|nr:hypothetical protein AGMMS49949_05730 [Alphaproteobacteria bacterium]GHS97696.1 hypothetical protein AGMMS50296_4900 [Alphaproteobacteria bacterium]
MNNYYNRFETSKNYEKSLFLAGRGLQSSELNEIQETALNKLKSLGDAIFKDGDVVRGCDCIVQENVVTVEAGSVYLRGAVRAVPQASLTINENQRFNIGLFLKETTVTELEDPTLRDPAVGTRNYQEPGAARMQYSLNWGAQAEGTTTDSTLGDFYPVYVVDQGVLILKSPAPELDSVKVALARYDRESNGSYIVRGFDVKYQNITNEQQIFVLNEGKAHLSGVPLRRSLKGLRVDGYEIELPHSVRLKYNLNPDLSTVQSEPHTFQPNEQGSMRIALNNPTCLIGSERRYDAAKINKSHARGFLRGCRSNSGSGHFGSRPSQTRQYRLRAGYGFSFASRLGGRIAFRRRAKPRKLV